MDESSPLTELKNVSDGFANVLTGLATARDKSRYGTFRYRDRLEPEQLADMYEQDAITGRIVDRVVDDATREGFTLDDQDKVFDFASVQSQLEDLDANNTVGDAWRWSRLYGGSILVMNIQDGRKMWEPLDLANARKLSSLHVIESPWVRPDDFNPGLGSRAFRRPRRYHVELPFGTGARERRIHSSRVIRFDGVRIPPIRAITNNGWGPSVIDRVHTEVSQLGEVMGYARTIMHDISIQVYKLKGMRDMICGDAKSQQDIRGIMETLRFSVDNLHLLALDSEDEYMEVTRTVTGLTELLNQFIDAAVRSTDMPRTILLGEQPGGLNANADSEVRAWFDFVKSQQKSVLTPALTSLLDVIFAIRANRGETVPTEYTIEYDALWQPSEADQAETDLKEAQTLEILAVNGFISPDQATARLMAAGKIPELEVPDEEPPPDEDDLEPAPEPDGSEV